MDPKNSVIMRFQCILKFSEFLHQMLLHFQWNPDVIGAKTIFFNIYELYYGQWIAHNL